MYTIRSMYTIRFFPMYDCRVGLCIFLVYAALNSCLSFVGKCWQMLTLYIEEEFQMRPNHCWVWNLICMTAPTGNRTKCHWLKAPVLWPLRYWDKERTVWNFHIYLMTICQRRISNPRERIDKVILTHSLTKSAMAQDGVKVAPYSNFNGRLITKHGVATHAYIAILSFRNCTTAST